ncbi:MAG: porin [Burkholderiaceae bacterium]|nr:porin [Burkholderiaceae bacterium]
MKKSLLAVAVLGAFAGAASAQSSVTMFGVIDLSGNYVENGGKGVYSLQSNQLNSNRLGFRGTEDLGGGLAAGFWLEAGMNNDHGSAGGSNGIAASAAGAANNGGTASNSVLFNRRSTVSLISKAGEIRLGRDYSPSFWNTVFGDVYGANGLGQALNVVASNGLANGAPFGGAYPTFARSNNSIGYFLPGGLGGLYGQVQVAAGENVANQKYMGGRIGYAAGPFDIAGAYGVTDGGNNPDFKVWNVMGTWNFGVVKVFGLYNEVEYGGAKLDTYSVSASVPLGQGEFKAGYSATDAKGKIGGVSIDADNGRLFSVQYIYNLSKRTALYTTFAKIDNEGKANFQVLGNGYSAAGDTSQGYNFGVRHSF